MKKVLSFVLVLAMVLCGVAPVMATAADDAVTNLNNMGIVQGYADGTFGLENNITRAEFAAIVVRMLGLEDLAKNSVYTSQFPDVKDSWYVGYVNVAAGKGIVKGNEDGTFAPQANVTYAQAATMIVRYLGEEVEGNVWPANYLAKATELGLLKNAQAVGNVMDPTTRGTVFTMANNALKTGESNKPVVSKVKALVIENSRVESLDNDEIVVQVMDDYTREDMNDAGNDNDTFNGLNAGAEFSYTVKKGEDVEYLLGKVVNLGFTGNKVTSIEVSDEYDYVSGPAEEIEKSSLEIDGREYTVEKEARFDDDSSKNPDRRFYQAYYNGDDKSYSSLIKESKKYDDEFDFVRATIKNGKVLFIDAYQFEDIAPVEDMKNDDMSVYEDDRKARTEKYDIADDYDAEDLIKVVVKDGKTELYRLDAADIEADQVAHITKTGDEILVRVDAKFDGEYTKVRTKKVDGDDETTIYYGDNKNEVELDKDTNERAVISRDGKDYSVLEEGNFKEDLKDFDDRDVEVLVDMFDRAQLIRSDFDDPRFFGVIDDMISDKIDLIGTDSKEDRYYLDTKTDVYAFELGKDKFDDIYDPKNNLNDKDVQEEVINEKGFLNENGIVYVEVADDNVIDTMVVIDIPEKEYFTTNVFDEDYIKNLDTKKTWEVDTDTKVYYLGDDDDSSDVEVYATVEDFLKDYEVDDDNIRKSVTAVVIEAEDTDDLADIIVVREAVEDGDLNEDMVVQIKDVDIDGDDISLVFEDASGKENTWLVDEDSAAYYKLERKYKKLAEELNISEDKAKDMLLSDDDIVEITYRESDKLIKSIQNFITEDNDNGNYRVYRLLDVTDSDAFVLGFDKDGAISKDFEDNKDKEDYYEALLDMDEDDFEDIDGKDTVYVNRDVDQFGDNQPKFIMVHLNKAGRIDATVEIEEDDAVKDGDYEIKEFATTTPKEEQEIPTPSEDEEVTFEINEKLGFYFLEVTDAPKDVDGFRFEDNDKIISLDKKDFIKSEESKVDVVLFDGNDEYKTVEIELEAGTQKVTFEK